jgi:carboxypeptidase D
LSENYSNISKLYSIGKSVEGRDLWVMEISDNPGEHEVLEPEFKLVANMHGNEVKGRVVAVKYIQHLLENYGIDPSITTLVETHRIHIMPR